MFHLVESVADFTNIIYVLAFDHEAVINSLTLPAVNSRRVWDGTNLLISLDKSYTLLIL